MRKVAIQGIKGSFHDIAAHRYFEGEDIELLCCDTFEEVFAHLHDEDDVVALVAIENTIAGSLLHNYELLRGERSHYRRRTEVAHLPQHHVSARG